MGGEVGGERGLGDEGGGARECYGGVGGEGVGDGVCGKGVGAGERGWAGVEVGLSGGLEGCGEWAGIVGGGGGLRMGGLRLILGLVRGLRLEELRL